MKKTGGFLKGVLDGLRAASAQSPKEKAGEYGGSQTAGQESAPESEPEVQEILRPEHFKLAKTVRHGFPFQPTAVAFDPIQRLLAIGTKSGSLRIFGRPGVECHVEHNEFSILQLLFLINEGALVSVTGDDCLHMWNLRQKKPEIAHSLKFQRERLSHCHLPFQSKWLYAGTEKGNVHLVNIESFMLSGYIIHWNKAIELSCKTHPGSVNHLSENPLDPNKLLIGYETGLVVLWDLRNRAADARFLGPEPLKSVAWQLEGRQFLCSYEDGSLATWNVKLPNKPQSVVYPHAKTLIDGKPEPCNGIYKVECKTNRAGECVVIFSGGLPYEERGKTPSLTIQQGRSTTVLEMDYSIVDFVTLCETPWQTEYQEPYAIVVLLERDLVLVDLTSPGFPCFQNPYPMDFHKSPVTYCAYFADCPNDLIPAFYSVGSMGNKQCGCSDKDWPIDGGEWGTGTLSYPEIVITGHADGSLQFWDASSVSFQVLYKLKTTKVFERPKPKSFEDHDEDPFAIDHVAFCRETRLLAVAGASSHVVLYNFKKNDATVELPVLEIPIKYEGEDVIEISTDCEPQPRSSFDFQLSGRSNSQDSGKQASSSENNFPLRVRTGPVRMAAGFHADLVCLTPGAEGEPPPRITALSIHAGYGLMAYGNEYGLAIVDIVQKTCLLNMGTPDLYGSADPYQRPPRSPRRTSGCANSSCEGDQGQSPTYEEVDGLCPSPTNKPHTGAQRKSVAAEIRHTRSQERIENAFSRSRSSSTSSLTSLKANNTESVLHLRFCESYGGKTDSSLSPSIWVGTSLGSVLVFLLIIPPQGEARQVQPVIISPSGTIYRLKGGIINISFLDATGAVISDSYDPIREREREEKKMKLTSRPSSTSLDRREKQFVVLTSERRSHVVLLPSQTGVFRNVISDTSYAVRAEVSPLKDTGSCLVCYIATGYVNIYSLPSLRQLLHVDFLPLVGARIARTLCFSANGHGLYLSSPSELEKFSISAAFGNILQEMMGTLFLTKDMPEPPKQGFFKGLFGGGPSLLDREELFGEASGKGSKGVARHISGGIEQAKCQTSSLGGELGRARQGLVERGEALSQLEERTARMMTEADTYANTSHQLLLKYRDKKWYQF